MATIIINTLPPALTSTPRNSFRSKVTRTGCLPSKVPIITSHSISSHVEGTTSRTELSHDQIPHRRSGNYQPPMWDFNYIQTRTNKYAGEMHVKRADELKLQVKMMLQEDVHQPFLNHLELIDDLQRLGLSYHFEEEIKRILASVHHNNNGKDQRNMKDLHATALEFRLLREHGFNLSQEIFDRFKDDKGDFKLSLCEDIKGMLSLYEASYLSIEGESTLDSAREFTAKHLKHIRDDSNDRDQALLVHQALELPLHWTLPMRGARWFIEVYARSPAMKPVLLELAKLNFNIVQAKYQDDLKYVSGWWKNMRVAENLKFVRDRVAENFFWSMGKTYEPEYGECRRTLAKITSLLTTIDDVYDVYGTLDELELFTNAVERWDIKEIDQLPDYMKVCFVLLYNTINEVAYDVLKEQGAHIIQYLSQLVINYYGFTLDILIILYLHILGLYLYVQWAGLCKTYLQEAKWYFSGYTPTLEEYMDNAWLSIAGHVMLTHVYVAITNPLEEESLERMERHDIIRWSSILMRLADDLGTSSDEIKRGDVPKSIQCYMKETGCSEEEAREHIWFLIGETWKKMNKDSAAKSPFSGTFIRVAKNLARTAMAIYQYGDGHGINGDPQTKDRISSLFFNPIPLE